MTTESEPALQNIIAAVPPFDTMRIGPFAWRVNWMRPTCAFPDIIGTCDHDRQEIAIYIHPRGQVMADCLQRNIFDAIVTQYGIMLLKVCTQDEIDEASDDLEHEMEDALAQFSLAYLGFMRDNPEVLKWMAACLN